VLGTGHMGRRGRGTRSCKVLYCADFLPRFPRSLPCCSAKPTSTMRSSPQRHRDQQRQQDQGGGQQGYVLDLYETTGDDHDRLLRFEVTP
jgi:hypothetical protein